MAEKPPPPPKPEAPEAPIAPEFAASEKEEQSQIDARIEAMRKEGAGEQVDIDLSKVEAEAAPKPEISDEEAEEGYQSLLRDVEASIENGKKEAAQPELTAIFGEQVPPRAVEMLGRLKSAQKREDYLAHLRTEKEEADKKRAAREARAAVKGKRRPRPESKPAKRQVAKKETTRAAIERMENEGGVAAEVLAERQQAERETIANLSREDQATLGRFDALIGRYRSIGKGIESLKRKQSAGEPEAPKGRTIAELAAEELAAEAENETAPLEQPEAPAVTPEQGSGAPEGSMLDKWAGYPQAYSELLKLLKTKYGKNVPESVQSKVSEVNARFLRERGKEERNPAELAACTALVESIIEEEKRTPAPAQEAAPEEAEASSTAEGTPAEHRRKLADAVKALEDLAAANRKNAGYVDYTETPHVEPAVDKETAWKDQVEKMRQLAKERAKESGEQSRSERLRGYLAERAKQLDASLAGKIEGGFRWLGEMYDKSHWGVKLGVNVGLGVGAGISAAAVSVPAIIGFSAAIALGRAGALSSMYLKFEKSASSKEMAMLKAMIVTATSTAGMAFLVKEVAESQVGAKAAEWSKEGADWIRQHVLGGNLHGSLSTETPAAHPAAPADMHAKFAPEGGQAQARAVENAINAKYGMPEVGAGKGHGYEWMAKRLWEQLHEAGRDTSMLKAPEGSDLEQLMNADEKSIDSVVHRLALENGAFENGTSAVISADSHLSFDADGNLSLDKGLVMPESAPAPVAGVDYPDATAELNQPVTVEHLQNVEAPQTMPMNEVPPVEAPAAEPQAPSAAPEAPSSVAAEAPAAAQPEVMYTAGDHVPIDITKPAIYEAHAPDGSSYLAAYGGTDQERMEFVKRYLEDPAHAGQRIRYASTIPSITGSFVKVSEFGGKVETPSGVASFFRFFEKQPDAPSPDTFLRKVSP